MATMLNAMVDAYNKAYGTDINGVSSNAHVEMPCYITNFMDGSYGKYP
jgi:hypothetical protein